MALTFAIYQGDVFLRRVTETHDILKVGKDARCHLRVEDPEASRTHAVIEVDRDGSITLIDLGNERGTMVNRGWVAKCKLKPGDEIQIGTSKIVLELVVDETVPGQPQARARRSAYEVILKGGLDIGDDPPKKA